jgi:predicted DNA-binding transcriptional regulator AlpA
MQSQFGSSLYVSEAQIIPVLGLSRSTLRRMVREGLFPMPVRFRGSVRYYVPEVMRTLGELHAARKARHETK